MNLIFLKFTIVLNLNQVDGKVEADRYYWLVRILELNISIVCLARQYFPMDSYARDSHRKVVIDELQEEVAIRGKGKFALDCH